MDTIFVNSKIIMLIIVREKLQIARLCLFPPCKSKYIRDEWKFFGEHTDTYEFGQEQQFKMINIIILASGHNSEMYSLHLD